MSKVLCLLLASGVTSIYLKKLASDFYKMDFLYLGSNWIVYSSLDFSEIRKHSGNFRRMEGNNS